MPEGGDTLAGYTGLPDTGAAYTRTGNCTALRIDGPFLVRGKNHVDYIVDGWLIKDEQGYMFGCEDADFAALFTAVP